MADRQSEQSILEKVFDPTYEVLKTSAYGSDGSNLQRLKVDASGNLKTTITDAGGEAVTVTGGKLDVNSAAPVGGATDDSLMLLRDIRKYLRASAYMDVGQRQIVKIGALGGISGGAEVTTTLPVSGSVTATVASTTITQIGGFDARFDAYALARIKYATGMRANLSFT